LTLIGLDAQDLQLTSYATQQEKQNMLHRKDGWAFKTLLPENWFFEERKTLHLRSEDTGQQPRDMAEC
jgi:hypothetical protein